MKALEVERTVVGDFSLKNPANKDGFMRVVTSVARAGDAVTVHTTDARLVDVFDKLDFDLDAPELPWVDTTGDLGDTSDLELKPQWSWGQDVGVKGSATITGKLGQPIQWSWKSGPVTAKVGIGDAHMSLRPSFHLNGRVEVKTRFSLRRPVSARVDFNAGAALAYGARVDFGADVTASAPLPDRKMLKGDPYTIMKFKGPKLRVYGPITAQPILKVDVRCTVFAEGNMHARLVFGASGQTSFRAWHDQDGFGASVTPPNLMLDKYVDVNATAGVGLECGLEPSIELAFNAIPKTGGSLSLFMWARAGFDAQFDAKNRRGTWQMDPRIDVGLRGKLEVVSFDVWKPEYTIKSWQLDNYWKGTF